MCEDGYLVQLLFHVRIFRESILKMNYLSQTLTIGKEEIVIVSLGGLTMSQNRMSIKGNVRSIN